MCYRRRGETASAKLTLFSFPWREEGIGGKGRREGVEGKGRGEKIRGKERGEGEGKGRWEEDRREEDREVARSRG